MIEIRDLKISYAYGKAFQVHDLRLEKGKITTIIGRNGSGKSTVLRAIAGLSRYQGSIRLNGKELRSIKPKVRAREMAYLPQILKPVNMDVETLIEHGRYPYQGNFRRLSERDLKLMNKALRLTGMENFASRSMQELSGGERQRAYLAMVIAQDAPMLLLDEPMTFMDLSYQKNFFEILKNLKNMGYGIAMVCHNIEQSFAVSDQICLMDDRTMIKTGMPEELVAEDKILRKAFGVAMKKSEDPDFLYPYIIRK